MNDEELEKYIEKEREEIKLLMELQRWFEIAYYSGSLNQEECEEILDIFKNSTIDSLDKMKERIDYLKERRECE